MAYETEQRLKSFLDANQLARERLCLALLSLDKRYFDVRPRHPRGGPDKGIDIDALAGDRRLVTAGAIGFVNGACDSNRQKNGIRKKFKEDAIAALKNAPPPQIFVFFTNVDLTLGEENSLASDASSLGFKSVDIFDRERMRIALDSVDGFAIRFQYLGLSLSEAEQTSFFARWGDEIQTIISSSFERVERTLNRLLFFEEANASLGELLLVGRLDRLYSAEEINHYRLFCRVLLHTPKCNIFQLLFGTCDSSERFYPQPQRERSLPGIKNGIGGAQWEQYIDVELQMQNDERLFGKSSESVDSQREDQKWFQVGTSSSIGKCQAQALSAHYSHTGSFFEFRERIKLRDLENATFILHVNEALAQKLSGISLFANEYEIVHLDREQLDIDLSLNNPEIPAEFTDTELADRWVRIRGRNSTLIKIDFVTRTPQRIYDYKSIEG